MRKLGALSLAAVIGVGTLATTDAQAGHRYSGHRYYGGYHHAGYPVHYHHHHRRSNVGAAVAAGILGAAAGGLLAASATPSHGYYAQPVTYGYPAPVYRRTVVRRYYSPAPVYRRNVVRYVGEPSYGYRRARYYGGYHAPVAYRETRVLRTGYAPEFRTRRPYGYGW